MTGLVWVDTLHLSYVQWTTLIAAMIAAYAMPSVKGLALALALMAAANWNVSLSTDTRLLFISADALRRFTWTQFLTEFAFADYVKLQPPFYAFWVSRWPALWWHQCCAAAQMLLAGALLYALYGQAARYLVSTPLFLLMSTQPGNDVALFLCLAFALRAWQLKRPGAASGLLGLAFIIKPLAVITFPVFAVRLRGWMLIAIGFVAAYYVWSIRWHFGVMQWGFLWRQLLFFKLFGPFAGGGGI